MRWLPRRFPHARWLLAAAVACAVGAANAQLPSDVLHQYRLDVVGPTGAREPVLVTFPRLSGRREHPDGHRWPLLVALHGLGEAQKGVQRGYLGWSVDYYLPRAYEAMLWGNLESSVLGNLVRRPHLRRINAWLRAQAYEGVAVVTPYTPSVLPPDRAPDRARFLAWLADGLLRQVREAYPRVSQTAAGTGIDGISLGGRLALEAGFAHPEAFGAVGGIQPAVRGDVAMLTGLVRPAAGQRIRLLTSDDDQFNEVTRELSDSLAARRIPHELVVVPGPHDYPFNRGPGAVELLRFAKRALRPEAP